MRTLVDHRRTGDLEVLASQWGVDEYWDTRPGQMSTGMCTRCLLVAALAGDPALLLLDEVRAPLDASGRTLLDEAIARCLTRGAVVIEVDHGRSVPGDTLEIAWAR